MVLPVANSSAYCFPLYLLEIIVLKKCCAHVDLDLRDRKCSVKLVRNKLIFEAYFCYCKIRHLLNLKGSKKSLQISCVAVFSVKKKWNFQTLSVAIALSLNDSLKALWPFEGWSSSPLPSLHLVSSLPPSLLLSGTLPCSLSAL